MSSRGRRIPSSTPTGSFAWGDHADVGTLDPLGIWQAAESVWGAPATDLRPPPPPAAPPDEEQPDATDQPAEPPAPTAEQQAHFAALERDAFTKGYAQGERAGLEAGSERAEAMLRRLAATLEELSSLRDQMMRQAERRLVELSLAIARRILQREVSVDPELAAALAHVALERLGSTAPAVIRLHPDDYTTVTAQDRDLWDGRAVKVVPDPAIARGGCRVESEFGYIDASVDAQMDEMARAMLGETTAPAARQGVA